MILRSPCSPRTATLFPYTTLFRSAAAADPALGLALIRASAPRSSDLGDHENRLLTIPDMGWQAFSAAPVQIRLVAGDHVTMLSGAGANKVAHAITSVLDPSAADIQGGS